MCGFYSKKKPTIQLLVNNQPILTAVNSSSYVIHHSSGKLKDTKHPLGTITGITIFDFIMIPSNCSIAISYNGQIG